MTEERRIVTSRERFTAVLGNRPRARILLKASTESEWVARHLESLGHEVIVADPNYAPMYVNRSRRTKTDTRESRRRQRDAGRRARRPTGERRRLRDAAREAEREGTVSRASARRCRRAGSRHR